VKRLVGEYVDPSNLREDASLHSDVAEGRPDGRGASANRASPTRPPRARAQSLAETIEGALIGHLNHHRDEIEAKLRGPT
jgi:hypothetical protein